ncbi:MAG: hypothetical protein ACFFB3_07950 [Candidatus Hodarchaeota archaeon]
MKEDRNTPKMRPKRHRKQIAALLLLLVLAVFLSLRTSSKTAHLAGIEQSGSPEEDTGESRSSLKDIIPFYDNIMDFLQNLWEQLFGDEQENGTSEEPREDEIKLPLDFTLSLELLLLILFLVLAVGLFAVLYYVMGTRTRVQKITEEEELQKRLDRLGRRVEEILEFVDRCLDEGAYTEGVIKGYQELDQALWVFSRLQRKRSETPLEHTHSVPKQLMGVQMLLNIVEQFYNRRYRMIQASKADLLEFRTNLMALVLPQARRMRPDWKEREEES